MIVRLIVSIIINIVLLVWFVLYAIRYNLVQSFVAHILKNKGSLDRIHRLQMRRKAGRKELKGFFYTISTILKNTGFRSMFPGSSPLWEAGLTLYIAIDIVVLSGFLNYVLTTRLLIGLFILILAPVIGQNMCRRRTYDTEAQLSDLGKMVENASIQYHSVGDIFANHYGEFHGALAYACEEFYINLLVNKDKKRSVRNFKEKFCSPMIDIMIENFVAGEEDEIDMGQIGHLSSEAAEEYVTATGGNRNMLNQARLRVTTSLILVLAAFFFGGFIVDGLSIKGLFEILRYEPYPVEFLPGYLQSGLGMYILVLSGALCILGVYQKKGF